MNLKAQVVVVAALLLAMEAAGQNRDQKNPSPKPDPRESSVGDDGCRSCHQDKVESYHRTAHYLTSRLPDQDSILGNFSPDANILKTSNPDLSFRMEAKNDGFFQTAVQGMPPYTTSRTERF